MTNQNPKFNPIVRSETMKDYDYVIIAAEVNFPKPELYTEFIRGIIAGFECGANGVIDHHTYIHPELGYVTEIAYKTPGHVIIEQIFQGPKVLKISHKAPSEELISFV